MDGYARLAEQIRTGKVAGGERQEVQIAMTAPMVARGGLTTTIHTVVDG
jgi:hypothetical protein